MKFNEEAVYKLRIMFSPGTEFASTLVLDSLASRMMRNTCLLHKLLDCWHFIIAAQLNKTLDGPRVVWGTFTGSTTLHTQMWIS